MVVLRFEGNSRRISATAVLENILVHQNILYQTVLIDCRLVYLFWNVTGNGCKIAHLEQLLQQLFLADSLAVDQSFKHLL